MENINKQASYLYCFEQGRWRAKKDKGQRQMKVKDR